MLAVLSGGTGTPKLLQGLKEVIGAEDLAVIVNTAEDKWLPHGYFSPDVDTVLYTLCDLIDEGTWHGIRGDSYRTHDRLVELGFDEVLQIGDLDRAVHIQRGELLRKSKSLSEAIAIQSRALNVRSKVYPMSNDPVETVILTDEGEMDLHEYLIEKSGNPVVRDVYIRGLESARACDEAVEAIEEADGIVIGPSNPISSILPILSVRGIQRALIKRRSKCIAVSPLIDGKAFSGPTEIFMRAKGLGVNSWSIAELYRDYISALIVHESEDAFDHPDVKCLKANTIMKTISDKKNLAALVLSMLGTGCGKFN